MQRKISSGQKGPNWKDPQGWDCQYTGKCATQGDLSPLSKIPSMSPQDMQIVADQNVQARAPQLKSNTEMIPTLPDMHVSFVHSPAEPIPASKQMHQETGHLDQIAAIGRNVWIPNPYFQSRPDTKNTWMTYPMIPLTDKRLKINISPDKGANDAIQHLHQQQSLKGIPVHLPFEPVVHPSKEQIVPVFPLPHKGQDAVTIQDFQPSFVSNNVQHKPFIASKSHISNFQSQAIHQAPMANAPKILGAPDAHNLPVAVMSVPPLSPLPRPHQQIKHVQPIFIPVPIQQHSQPAEKDKVMPIQPPHGPIKIIPIPIPNAPQPIIPKRNQAVLLQPSLNTPFKIVIPSQPHPSTSKRSSSFSKDQVRISGIPEASLHQQIYARDLLGQIQALDQSRFLPGIHKMKFPVIGRDNRLKRINKLKMTGGMGGSIHGGGQGGKTSIGDFFRMAQMRLSTQDILQLLRSSTNHIQTLDTLLKGYINLQNNARISQIFFAHYRSRLLQLIQFYHFLQPGSEHRERLEQLFLRIIQRLQSMAAQLTIYSRGRGTSAVGSIGIGGGGGEIGTGVGVHGGGIAGGQEIGIGGHAGGLGGTSGGGIGAGGGSVTGVAGGGTGGGAGGEVGSATEGEGAETGGNDVEGGSDTKTETENEADYSIDDSEEDKSYFRVFK